MQQAAGNFQEVLPKIQALTKEYTDKAVAALNDSQKTTWKGLVGEPFTVQGRGGRGGDE
jgi:hypothetical protein